MKLKHFRLARQISKHSTHHQHMHGCVITRGNKVISVGFNKIKTNPNSNHPYYSTHAELSAVLKADRSDLIGATVYVYREHRDGTLANSKPCKSCQNLLVEAQVSMVYYSTETGYEGENYDFTK
jgi:deoxycytidylate deaminase